jgi:hypothetical protein
MSVKEIAEGMVALCREGKFEEAMTQYYSPDIVSIEAMEGEGQVAQGLEAVKAKGDWWTANHEIHSVTVSDPYPSGDQFAIHFSMDITYKQNNQRMTFDEIAVYKVVDGKIVHEQFFYSME